MSNASTIADTPNLPRISVVRTTAQSIPNSTWTKLQLDTKNIDRTGAYDNTTNYRFQPTKAGDYSVFAQAIFTAVSGGYSQVAIYKNGSLYEYGDPVVNNATVASSSKVTSTINLNGTTDYIEVFVWQSSGAALNIAGAAGYNRLNAFLIT